MKAEGRQPHCEMLGPDGCAAGLPSGACAQQHGTAAVVARASKKRTLRRRGKKPHRGRMDAKTAATQRVGGNVRASRIIIDSFDETLMQMGPIA